jgi:uncharacterized glyoxalase superfamily protein PhnB
MVSMELKSIYPVLLLEDIETASRFVIAHLGFRETFRNDWYVSVAHARRPEYELAFVRVDHESVPEAVRAPSNVLLNVEVDDATYEYDRLRAAGVSILRSLRDEPWGQRHFIGAGPGGLLLDVIEEIPPVGEYADQYTGGAREQGPKAP